MWQLALIHEMGLSAPCQSYSSVWANCAARIENSSSSWLIFWRRRISSAAISSPARSAVPPTPLCILRLYEQTFGESTKRIKSPRIAPNDASFPHQEIAPRILGGRGLGRGGADANSGALRAGDRTRLELPERAAQGAQRHPRRLLPGHGLLA